MMTMLFRCCHVEKGVSNHHHHDDDVYIQGGDALKMEDLVQSLKKYGIKKVPLGAAAAAAAEAEAAEDTNNGGGGDDGSAASGGGGRGKRNR